MNESALRLEKVLDLSLVDNHVYWKTNYTSLTPAIQIKMLILELKIASSLLLLKLSIVAEA